MISKTTEGLIIKRWDYGTTSKGIEIYTERFGKIRVIIKGGRTPGTRYSGIGEVFNRIKITISDKNYGGYHYFEKGELVKRYSVDRTNLSIIFKIFSVIDKFPLFVPSKDIYRMLINIMKLSESNNDFKEAVYYVFLYRIVVVSGYKPELYVCVKCGEGVSFFSVEDGGRCKRHKQGIELSEEEWENLRVIASSSFAENIVIFDKIKALIESYYNFHMKG